MRGIKILACIAMFLASLMPASEAMATWASDNCHGGDWDMPRWKRSRKWRRLRHSCGEIPAMFPRSHGWNGMSRYAWRSSG